MKDRQIDEFTLMPIDELWSLHEKVVLVLSSKILDEKAQLDFKLSKLEVSQTDSVSKRRYPAVLPKFRNPMRPSETWAGRGRQPRWLSAQLRTGKNLDDFRIRTS
jgi:DNA-binding protein H-NS